MLVDWGVWGLSSSKKERLGCDDCKRDWCIVQAKHFNVELLNGTKQNLCDACYENAKVEGRLKNE